MARADKNGMIDGYMAVQSVRRNSDRQQDRSRPAPGPAEDASPAETPVSGTPGATGKPHPFGQTALPTRHDIHCYACGYQFTVSGRLDRVLCPKCKEQLHTGDKTICGPFTGTIQTVGTVTIHSGASVSESEITASIIRIAGTCHKTRLHPGVRIELQTGADIDRARLETVDVVIEAGQVVNIEAELHCRTLHLMGRLRAHVTAREQVLLAAGASFQGRLQAPGLVIEDGAALRADLHIQPHPENQTQAPGHQSPGTGGQ